MKVAVSLSLAALALSLAGCGGGGSELPPAPPPGAIPAGTSIGSGTISGRVVLDGPAPAREKIHRSDSNCAHADAEEPLTESVVVNSDGSLRNVIVRVTSGLGDRVFAPAPGVVLDQKGCVYRPHVIAVESNQIVTFLNSDKTIHNIHAVSKINPPFNKSMSVQGQRLDRFFGKPEILKVKCDVHGWMSSWIGVFDNPFHAVTGDGGTFELKGLPAGSYEIEAWQETLGTKTQKVTLADGETRTLEIHFGS